ncbi:PTS system, mannose-specific IID component [Streptococcus infantarius subsp. infantarius CJ18]|nr:PTS system, mannose-specific IID component [Streptococcus infantarius subsp. infantarius CJ18]
MVRDSVFEFQTLQQNQKNISPIKVMLLLVVVAFVGVLVGFFNPGLSY